MAPSLTINSILQRADLPAMPEIYFRLQHAIDKNDDSPDSISEIICTDPALAAHLLQIVNCAMFRFGGRVDSIATAVHAIHLADIIVVAMEFGSSGEYTVPPLAPQAWERIALPESVLPSVVAQIDRQFSGAVKAFCGN